VTLNELCQNKEVRDEAVTTSYARTSHLSHARTRARAACATCRQQLNFQDSTGNSASSDRAGREPPAISRPRNDRPDRNPFETEKFRKPQPIVAACHGYSRTTIGKELNYPTYPPSDKLSLPFRAIVDSN